MTMNPQITAILTGVKDLDRSKRFYGEGLGCPIDKDYPQFVSFKLGDGSSEFGLYPREALAADAGVAPEGSGFTGVPSPFIGSSNKEPAERIGQPHRPAPRAAKPAQASERDGHLGHFA